MSKIRLYGDTSGYIDVAAPATADNSKLDLSTVAKLNQENTFTQNQYISGGDGITQEIRSSGNQAHFRMVSDLNNSSWMMSNESNANRMRIMHTDTGSSTNTFPMYIYEAGYVTMPYQPAFMAVNAANGVRSGGDPVSFSAVNTNVGNHFDTSTSRFNVPVSGTYHFDFGIYCYSGENPSFAVQNNGSQYHNADVVPNLYDTAQSYSRILTGSFVASATAGDYITLNVRVGGYSANIYGGHSWFAGHLIG